MKPTAATRGEHAGWRVITVPRGITVLGRLPQSGLLPFRDIVSGERAELIIGNSARALCVSRRLEGASCKTNYRNTRLPTVAKIVYENATLSVLMDTKGTGQVPALPCLVGIAALPCLVGIAALPCVMRTATCRAVPHVLRGGGRAPAQGRLHRPHRRHG
jgi:hypothetical protein